MAKKNHYLHKLYSTKKYKKPLKRSKTGYEIELAILDNDGNISNTAPEILDIAKKKLPELPIKKEIPQHMLEIHSFPSIHVQNTALSLIENVEKVMDVIHKKDCYLFPLGTYPGTFTPKVWEVERYIISAKVLGKEKYDYAFSVCHGFHCHYTMPRGVFDYKKGFLKELTDSKVKQTLIDSYNMLIAMDPVLTTLLQSSPFVSGKYIAKDSRNLLWRGGKKLRYVEGVFSKYQQLGGLPPYKQTLTDLMQSLRNKDQRWKKGLRKAGVSERIIKKKPLLDFVWCPVKVNKLGTLEQRGMDMNHLRYVIAASVLIKYVLRKIQQDFLLVMPSDIAIEEPFKIEGNVVFVPPHTYVRNELQYLSDYEGLGNKTILDYCKRFIRFATSIMHSRYKPVIGPILKMLDEEETVSDAIIKKVKKMGYTTKDKLPQKVCQEIALYSAEKLLFGINETKKRIENLD